MGDVYVQKPRGTTSDPEHPDAGQEHREQPTMTGRKTAPKPTITTIGPRGRNG